MSKQASVAMSNMSKPVLASPPEPDEPDPELEPLPELVQLVVSLYVQAE